ncbi:MAG: YhcH/YjgK/YiaL family protein [Shewanella sp.]|nr:YhcH/YjgK/YiaL family protein [Shewanella sp.]MCF1458468.1 YhcH/YjgK/YiaL family protein [Shewanella sp.]
MILDTLANRGQYINLHPGIALALEHLATTDYSQAPTGRYDIDGDRVFAIVNDYAPRDRTTSPLEIHREYIDVQLVVRGEEACGYLPLAGRTPDSPYHAGRDFAEFTSAPLLDETNFITLKAGMFAIFFPEDIHMPGAAPGSEQVRKVVVKVKY